MAIRIGINGFGRIGRIILRQAKGWNNLKVVGVNDVVPAKTLAHLFKYDSTHGRYKGTVQAGENSITVDGNEIPIFNCKEPSKIPWKDVGADIVLECSGRFTDKLSASEHLKAGAKKIIISAPATDPDATFCYGVNHKIFDSAKHTIVSNASCTTNCLAPMAYVLHKNFCIEKGFMTTVHSYTNDQQILDAPHKDLRRARSGAANQIPTTNVSCTDFVCLVKKETTTETVLTAFKSAAAGELKNILGVEMDPLVSSDFLGDTRSSIVDGLSTKVMGNLVKVIAWYDNEVGFSCRMLDLSEYIGERL